MDEVAQGVCGVEMRSVYRNVGVLVYTVRRRRRLSCEGKREDRAIDVGRNQNDVV